MLTYSYETGRITRDFVFKKPDGNCNKDGRNIPIGVFCKTCEHFRTIKEGFILCGYHKTDDPGYEPVRDRMYVRLRIEALDQL